jgi:hypothetical protein
MTKQIILLMAIEATGPAATAASSVTSFPYVSIVVAMLLCRMSVR